MVNSARRFRAFGKWSLPAWILVLVAAIFFVVDMFQRIDWLIAVKSSRAAQWAVGYASQPRGFVSIFIAGVAWLTILVFSSREEQQAETLPKEVKRRLSDVIQESPATPAPMPQTALNAEPNIVVVEARAIRTKFVEGRIVEDRQSGTLSAIVSFRNDAIRGRQIDEMVSTKAHLRFESGGRTILNIDAGCWLDAEFNTVDFSPGESHSLVVGVQAEIINPREIRTHVPDDRRVDTDSWLDIRWHYLTSDDARVHVKLVGGWPKISVFEFVFDFRRQPFGIESVDSPRL